MRQEIQTDLNEVVADNLIVGQQLAPEIEAGNREYKLMLTNLSDEQLIHRITQLNWRLNEGNGEAYYLIGVEDNGNQLGLTDGEMQESLKNLQYMANEVKCDMFVKQLFCGVRGKTAEVHFKRRERQTVNVVQIAVAVAGEEDAGKSSLIGVLCSGRLDSGRGSARSTVLTHNHELQSGKTSCISHRSLHFSKDGQVLNAQFQLGSKNNALRQRALSDLELADCTDRVVNLIDLAGSAKYLKTTLHGLIGCHPQYSMICLSAVSSNATISTSMTSEHIGICLYLRVPLLIVITKVDMASVEQIESTMKSIRSVLKEAGLKPLLIDSATALADYLTSRQEDGNLVPVFQISNVTGARLELLQSCLHQLPAASVATANQNSQQTREPLRVRILSAMGKIEEPDDEESPEEEEDVTVTKRSCQYNHSRRALNVHNSKRHASEIVNAMPSVPILTSLASSPTELLRSGGTSTDSLTGGLVEMSSSPSLMNGDFSSYISQGDSVSTKVLVGHVESGVLSLRDTVMWGPTADGQFIPVEVSSIRVNNVAVQFGVAGQTLTFKLAAVKNVTPFSERMVMKEQSSSRQLKRSAVKGMVLLSPGITATACWEFEAELFILNHPNKIRVNYEPVIHVGCVTQCARITSIKKAGHSRSNSADFTSACGSFKSTIDFDLMDIEDGTEVNGASDNEISNGEKAIVRFRFLYYPEFLTVGSSLIIREERIKGVGMVTSVV